MGERSSTNSGRVLLSCRGGCLPAGNLIVCFTGAETGLGENLGEMFWRLLTLQVDARI